MDRMWGRPGAGAPLSQGQKDYARKQKRKEINEVGNEGMKIILASKVHEALTALPTEWASVKFTLLTPCPVYWVSIPEDKVIISLKNQP